MLLTPDTFKIVIATIALFLMTGPYVSQAALASAGSSSLATLQIILTFLIAAGLAVAAPLRTLWSAKGNFLMLAYAGIAVILSLTITASYGYDSLRAALLMAAVTVSAVAIASNIGAEGVARALVYALALSVCLCVIWATAAPEQGTHQQLLRGAWRGIYAHKNLLGQLSACALVVFAFCSRTYLPQPTRLIAISVAAVALYMSKSATGLVVALCATLALMWFDGPKSLRWFILLIIGSIMAATIAVGPEHIFELLASLLGRDTTLTGRTAIWQYYLNYIATDPLQYNGYIATSFPGSPVYIAGDWGGSFTHAHNGLLDVYLGLGVFGSVLILLAIGAGAVGLLTRVRRSPSRAIFIVVLSGWLVSSLGDSTLRPGENPLGTLAWAALAAAGAAWNHARSHA